MNVYNTFLDDGDAQWQTPTPPPTDPRVLAVAEVTHRLSRANSNLKKMPAEWKIAVVDAPDTVNAMCLAVCV